MNLKIKNPKLTAMLLASSITLTTVGCREIFDDKTSFKEINVDTKKSVKTKTPSVLVEKVKKLDTKKEYQKNTGNYSKLTKVRNNVYAKKTIKIKSSNDFHSKSIKKIGIYQKAKELAKTENGWSLVKYKGIKGYVKSKYLGNLGDTYIEIDISKQKIKYVKDNKNALITSVVTGKDTTPTVMGKFDVYQKCRDYTMHGYDSSGRLAYTSHSDYVLKFYKAYYIHDASWRTAFGGNIYKYSGSHGCVNTPYQKVKKLYNITKLHTNVLIHK